MRLSGLVLASVSLFGLAVAVGVRGGEPGGGSEAMSEDILRGPKVEVESVPGVDESMSTERRRGDRVEPRIRHPQFLAALRALAEEAPEDVRPSPGQVEAVRKHEAEFQAQVDAFREAHGKEIRELREQLGPAFEGRRGNREAMERAFRELSPEKQAVALRLEELVALTPRPEATHVSMWSELTDAQREWVESWLDENVPSRERQQRRAREAEGAVAVPVTREALLARLEALPAGQQEVVLRELEKAIVRAERSAAHNEAPSMDSVELPDMEPGEEGGGELPAGRPGRGGESGGPSEPM